MYRSLKEIFKYYTPSSKSSKTMDIYKPVDLDVFNMIDEFPPEIIHQIDRLIHKSFQANINKEILKRVERIEDAQEMDPSLEFYHIHHKSNCSIPPFLFSESYKRSTYHWVYETSDTCLDNDYKDNCSKRKIQDQDSRFYMNGDQYSSHWEGRPRKVKLRKLS